MTSYMGLFSARPGLPGSSRDGLRSVKAFRISTRHLPLMNLTVNALLVGELAELEAAALAFVEAVRSVPRSPLQGSRRP